MSVREDLKILLVKENLTLVELADIVSKKADKKITANNLSHKLNRKSLKYDELKELVEAIGYEIKFEKKKEDR
ncbi:MAG: hypothetical protein PHC64_00810 [Candidatus Gastranaerophilales bacterium]|nr:hypothetical protein [Candidatus Gastranaerophilales bacterium]